MAYDVNETLSKLLAAALQQLLDVTKVVISPEHPISKSTLSESNPKYADLQHTIQTVANSSTTLLRVLSQQDTSVMMGLIMGGETFANMVRMRMGLEFGFLLGAAYMHDPALLDGLFKAVDAVQEYLKTLPEVSDVDPDGDVIDIGSKLVQ